MGARTEGRESALQMLFAMEANGGGAERIIASYWRETPGDPEGRAYADDAVRGVAADLDAIDEAIRKASTNWRLERMARVDRNLIRLALYELKYVEDVPAKVAINEAIEIAKRYGTNESSAFVNGILDRCREELGKK
jgi:transcription antitermination protein NusB